MKRRFPILFEGAVRRFFSLCFVVLATAPVFAATTLIPTGAVWKYLDDGSDQGTAWREGSLTFNDASWPSGAAQLGYGDGDEVTVVGFGPDASNKYITTYFRQTFGVTNAGSFSNVTLRVLRDDGAVVYVNGTEVFRSNMPDGPIAYNTLALSAIGGPQESTEFVSASIGLSVLHNGPNVVVVEIHQVTPTSSDLSFDLELTADFNASTNPPPELPIVNVLATDPQAPETGGVAAINPGRFTFSRSGDLNNALAVSFTLGGSASNGVDYLWITNRVSFGPGTAQVNVNITPINDALLEGTETVVLTLEQPACIAIFPPPPGCYMVGPSNQATVFIADFPVGGTNNVPIPGVGVFAADASASEAYGTNNANEVGIFRFWREGATNNALTVFYSLGGTASNGIDYQTLSGSVTMPVGASVADVLVRAIGDSIFEPEETVVLTLRSNAAYRVGTSNNPTATSAIVYITSIDPPATNHPPLVTLNSPHDGAVFNAPTNVELRAYARDTEDGYQLSVEFFAGPNKLGDGTFVGGLCPVPACSYFALTWSNVPPGYYALTAKVTDSSGATVSSEPVHITVAPSSVRPAPRPQEKPAVASNGDTFLVVWADQRDFNDSGWDIYGARVTPDGQVLDPNGIRICAAPGLQGDVSVASDGHDFLVMWNDDRDDSAADFDIYAARVTAGGVVMDPNGFPVSRAPWAQFYPSVAFNGTHYLAVWYDYRNSTDRPFNDIYGARISREGVVLDPDGIAICTADDMQWAPGVAAFGSDFFVAWDDSRYPTNAIRGTSVTTSGGVLNPDGLILSPNFSGYPIRVAANATGYLTVWTDPRDYQTTGYNIFGQRVSPSGDIVGSDLVLSSAAEGQVGPAVAGLGEEFLAVWLDDRFGAAGTSIFGTRVGANGVLDPNGIRIGFAPSSSSGNAPAVAGMGDQYLVVWVGGPQGTYDSLDIVGARLKADGTVLDTNAFLISTVVPTDPVITWSSPAPIVYGTPLSGAQLNASADVPGFFLYTPFEGTVLNAGDYALLASFIPNDQVRYNIVDTQVELQVAPAPLTIRADNKTRAQGQPNPPLTASYSGFVAGETPSVLDMPVTLATTATEASPPGTYPIVASGASDSNYAITQLNGTLTVLPASPTNTSASNDQLNPAVASDGTNFLVVWWDRRNADSTEFDIYGARVSATGEVLDPDGIPICTAPDYQLYPAVAFDGENYLVVWSDARDNTPEHPSLEIYGARVSRQGAVLDPGGFNITHGELAYNPTVTFNGVESLVVAYARDHNGQSGSTLLGVRVTPTGEVRDTDELILRPPEGPENPVSVASSGGNWLVVWGLGSGDDGVRVNADGILSSPISLPMDGEIWFHSLAAVGNDYFLASVANREIGPDTYVLDVLGTWIGADGQPRNTILIAANTNRTIGSHLQPTTYIQEHPAAITNGSGVWVAWEAGTIYTNGGVYKFLSDIRGARVGVTNGVSPVISICAASQEQSYPALAFNGQRFLAVWQDARSAPPDEYSPSGEFDIYGARLTTLGLVIERNGFLISGARSNVPPPDADHDGVPDEIDQCPNTAPGSIVNAQGCSIAQLCPCDGSWQNHGEYVRCVVSHAWEFYRQGLITADQRRSILHQAVMSDCGRRAGQPEPLWVHPLPVTREECLRDGFQFILSGDATGGCVIESSTDLVHWTAVDARDTTVTGEESGCPIQTDLRACFYRVRLLP